MPKLIVNTNRSIRGDTLVVLLLEGGMDGLYVVPPHNEAALRHQRLDLALPETGRPGGAIDLDGVFGLHPLLASWSDLFRAGHLAVVHACGSPDQTLSHFEASLTLQTGGHDSSAQADGWLTRHLASAGEFPDGENASKSLRAVAFGTSLPPLLRGSTSSVVLSSLSELRLNIPSAWSPDWAQTLSQLYAIGKSLPSVSGRNTIRMLDDLKALQRNEIRDPQFSAYDPSPLGRQLKELCTLIRANVGLEVAVVRQGGWDAHQGQDALLQPLLKTLSRSIRAFYEDLGDCTERVTIVVLTEFGRRVRVNLAKGTDHGRGTAMFVIGGGIQGGKVYGEWPGLEPEQLDEGGNLRVTTDFRDVLAEVALKRLANPAIEKLFPGYTPKTMNICTHTGTA